MPPKSNNKVRKPAEKEPEEHSSGEEELIPEDIDSQW